MIVSLYPQGLTGVPMADLDLELKGAGRLFLLVALLFFFILLFLIFRPK